MPGRHRCMWLAASLMIAIIVAAADSRANAAPNARPPAQIIYVDDDAPRGGDGWSWATALRHLQDALALASNPPPGIEIAEIRVAQGTYKPDQGAGQTPGDVHASFYLVNGVALRGGFAGINAPHPDQQDLAAFPTILSGDLLGNDGPDWSPGTFADNSRSVVRAIDLDQLTLVEGVIITRGIRGVPFPNSFEHTGAGLFGIGSRLHIRDCVIEYNAAGRGGGVGLVEALDTIVERCTFSWNRATYLGGGMFIGAATEETSIRVSDSLFANQNIGSFNPIASAGGLAAPAHAVIARCDFVNNYALFSNGAASGGTFIDCTFIGNSSDEVGGVSARTLIGCHVSGNLGIFGTGGAAVVNAVNSTFVNNFASSTSSPGGGGNPGGAGIHAWDDIVNCRFVRNRTIINGKGGAAVTRFGSGTRFINSLFNATSPRPRPERLPPPIRVCRPR